jgi:hypothetical protein
VRRKTAAREVALQALYAWQLSGADPMQEARANEAYEKSVFLDDLLRGVSSRAAELEALITPHLDRKFARLSPVERAILYIGAYELSAHPNTPFRQELRRHRRLPLRQWRTGENRAGAAAGRSRPLAQPRLGGTGEHPLL